MFRDEKIRSTILVVAVLFLLIFEFLIRENALLAASEKKPNLLVIMVDDLGYGDLSCYGAPDLKSPHIDELFASGMRFNQFYANCPVCSPTRASFLTGMYPDIAGVPGVIRTNPDNSWGNLRNDLRTLPTHLSEAGYDTALIGKWHLGLKKPDRPNDIGFDEFKGFLGDMMDDYYHHRRRGFNYMRENFKEIDPKGHATDLFTDWAVNYIEKAKGKDKPFFMFLAYNAPHTPIQPPKDWLEKVQAREKGIDEKRAKLVALIEHLDEGVGKVIESLKATGQAENTVVIFTSDNGGQDNVGARNLPLRGAKQNMWEGGLRVGTCAVWPGKIKAGTVQDDHISLTMDLYPTLAEIAGQPVDFKMDGRSFLPVLLGKPFKEKPRTLFFVRREGNMKYGGMAYHAVRRGDWKLFRNNTFEPYIVTQVGKDPGETNDMPLNKLPKDQKDLFPKLMKHIQRAGNVPWQ